MSEEKKMTFVYLRDGDRVDANRMCAHISDVHLILALSKGGFMKLPEGREVLEFRKEHEDAGVDFRYRLDTFKAYLSQQDQDTVKKWQGIHETVHTYPKAPEGTFWKEWMENGEWHVGLMSLEDGEPVEGHKTLISKTAKELLARSTGAEAEAALAEDEEAEDASEEEEVEADSVEEEADDEEDSSDEE